MKVGNSTIKHYYANPLARAGGQRIATRDSEGLKFNHTDHLGSASRTSNTSGAQVKALWYDPWGDTAASIGSAVVKYTYTGKEKDASTGLFYYGARYYDPVLGRFVSPDTIIPNVYDPQALNPYAYCLNNPVRFVDPDGHRTYSYENQPPYGSITKVGSSSSSSSSSSSRSSGGSSRSSGGSWFVNSGTGEAEYLAGVSGGFSSEANALNPNSYEWKLADARNKAIHQVIEEQIIVHEDGSYTMKPGAQAAIAEAEKPFIPPELPLSVTLSDWYLSALHLGSEGGDVAKGGHKVLGYAGIAIDVADISYSLYQREYKEAGGKTIDAGLSTASFGIYGVGIYISDKLVPRPDGKSWAWGPRMVNGDMDAYVGTTALPFVIPMPVPMQ